MPRELYSYIKVMANNNGISITKMIIYILEIGVNEYMEFGGNKKWKK